MSKNINVNELQSQVSKILKNVEKGEVFEVMRYSKPIAVVLSYPKYLKLKGECKECIQDLRKLVK
ncbi:MAG: hypothetical protein US94_C0033G0005 [Berkelbacteria bacterium GW2011_GWB1_38_5]|uniref:Uncharacterized protein n=2 Tax=Candidatus Berkelbacteria TaxID=1618330 RepID=A0A0G0LQS3_9BACT|nr:MAG: hypothetical protein US94_C0033G0005 [Berkelbacteria bacterium GW2011_GWB1_38_5]KKQ90330.1 MAG: hypothetical protein UT15_C0015G0003 [Berkelbacteria bacterium GW2011_GWA1_39_10]